MKTDVVFAGPLGLGLIFADTMIILFLSWMVLILWNYLFLILEHDEKWLLHNGG